MRCAAAVARGFADKKRLRTAPELALLRLLPAFAEIETGIGKPAGAGGGWWGKQFR